jgi:hypothetical protein
MWSEISKILINHYPYICILLFLVAVAVYVGFKIAKIHFRFLKTEEDCKSIFDVHLKKIDTSISGVQTSITGMQTSVINLIMYLKTKDEKFDTSLFRSQSPIHLTDLGSKILTDIGGKKAIEDNIEKLMLAMEAQEFKSGLDVQNYASVLVMNMFNDEMFTHVKNYMFSNPIYKHPKADKEVDMPLDMATVNTILGIYLRDKYFEKHPELNKNEE